jgi:hypothetical protein
MPSNEPWQDALRYQEQFERENPPAAAA